MDQQNKPFLKGRLTKVSIALLAVINSPELLHKIHLLTERFAEPGDPPKAGYVIASVLGIAWGVYRRSQNYFETPFAHANPVQKGRQRKQKRPHLTPPTAPSHGVTENGGDRHADRP